MFSENSRVKIPAIIQLTRLGYDYLSLRDPSVHSQIDLDTNIFRDVFTNSLVKINSTNTPPPQRRFSFANSASIRWFKVNWARLRRPRRVVSRCPAAWQGWTKANWFWKFQSQYVQRSYRATIYQPEWRVPSRYHNLSQRHTTSLHRG